MRGRFKWVCLDCKAENWIPSKELIRAFRPRCSGCGSTWLEPSKASEAKDRLTLGQTARDAQREEWDAKGFRPR